MVEWLRGHVHPDRLCVAHLIPAPCFLFVLFFLFFFGGDDQRISRDSVRAVLPRWRWSSRWCCPQGWRGPLLQAGAFYGGGGSRRAQAHRHGQADQDGQTRWQAKDPRAHLASGIFCIRKPGRLEGRFYSSAYLRRRREESSIGTARVLELLEGG
jgi:hypothetical protein